MKYVICRLFCVILSVLSIVGGALLFAKNFPEDIIWNLAGGVLALAGAAAIISIFTGAGKEKTA